MRRTDWTAVSARRVQAAAMARLLEAHAKVDQVTAQ